MPDIETNDILDIQYADPIRQYLNRRGWKAIEEGYPTAEYILTEAEGDEQHHVFVPVSRTFNETFEGIVRHLLESLAWIERRASSDILADIKEIDRQYSEKMNELNKKYS